MSDQRQSCKGHLNSIKTWINHVRVRRLCRNFVLPNTKLREFMNRMTSCIHEGLGKETHSNATIKCWQTYVQNIPHGDEKGKFLALDLGGSNFRVLNLELGPNKYFKMKQETYEISKTLMNGSGTILFDYIANCLNNFATAEELKNQTKLPLGFTFSFPMYQSGISSGELVRWTKGFTCDGVVGQDVVQLLTKSINKIPGLNVRICAILNDTVGTLMSCAWLNPKTRIALIIGTGCNCCYVEKIKNIQLYNGDQSKEEMVINLEWGAFGDNKELEDFHTKYDKVIDDSSENRGQQIFEKMVSGMYLGELFRLVLLDLIEKELIFDGIKPPMINAPRSVSSDVLSLIENDPPGTYANTRKFLQKIGVANPTDGDCMNVRYATECITRRSAYLVAAGLTAILNKMNEKEVIIGVDGSVYRFHPYYHNLLMGKISELVNSGIKFGIMLSQDGSGRGAAVLASVVCPEE